MDMPTMKPTPTMVEDASSLNIAHSPSLFLPKYLNGPHPKVKLHFRKNNLSLWPGELEQQAHDNNSLLSLWDVLAMVYPYLPPRDNAHATL